MPAAARPVPHYDKWRIRWLDQEGKRQSAVFDDFDEAKRQLRKHQTEVDEIRDGTRVAIVPNKTFGELADYWLKHRAPQKRSKADDESIIRDLRKAFGPLTLRALGAARIDVYVAERSDLAVQTIRNRLTLFVATGRDPSCRPSPCRRAAAPSV